MLRFVAVPFCSRMKQACAYNQEQVQLLRPLPVLAQCEPGKPLHLRHEAVHQKIRNVQNVLLSHFKK
jgi:hypothetical protein